VGFTTRHDMIALKGLEDIVGHGISYASTSSCACENNVETEGKGKVTSHHSLEGTQK
jgi:hypothetical protein